MTITTKIVDAVATNAALINNANTAGYKPVYTGSTKVKQYAHCPNCEASAKAAIAQCAFWEFDADIDLKLIPWINVHTAIIFHKKGYGRLTACRCGYRKLSTITIKPMCPNEGCNVTLRHEGDRCYKCNPPTAQELATLEAAKEAAMPKSEPTVKMCIEPGCKNVVPEGRYVRCEYCRAKRRTPKETVSNGVQM